MLGIIIEDPTYIYMDNKSVLINSTAPESSLKKKSNSTACHFVREGVARKEWLITYINSKENPVNTFTKLLNGGVRSDSLVRLAMYDIYVRIGRT